MKPVSLKINCALALVIGGIVAVGPVMADKPEWAGNGNGKKNQSKDKRDEQRGEQHDKDGRSGKKGSHFEDRHRVVVREYYGEQFRGGHCPPGLAKKHNGCMPPGQAKKWKLGRPLPHDVVFYEVPQALVVRIGPPPSGYRYVRVASDVLLIAIGTSMVVDAIQDLGR
jgi:Ni/Co efflux regulator RcnB